MAQESIDFLTVNRKIIVNPAVPLQLLDIHCRNQASRVQATILGKIYSNSIQVLEIVPEGLPNPSGIKAINFEEPQQSQHFHRGLENIMTVYPTLEILGAVITDLGVDINLAKLHTLYSHKESGFKPHGILTYPLILSVGTKLNQDKQFDIKAYTYNQSMRFIKEVMDVTPFERLDVEISFGAESDIQSHTPLFEALNDNQERWVPSTSVLGGENSDSSSALSNQKAMVEALQKNLLSLKEKTDNDGYDKLNKKLKRIIDALNQSDEYSMQDLGYLLDLAGLYRKMALKMNKFL